MENDFTLLRDQLLNDGKAERTIQGYLADLNQFSHWFSNTNGENLSPKNLTPTDVREYRQYLLVVKKAKPATINRHLAAIRAYGNWANNSGLVANNPAEKIKSISQQSQAPKWLDKKEQAAVIREVERRIMIARTVPAKRKAIRDHTILIILLNTGLRVSELVNLEISDIILSDRKGELRVRAGKGMKERIIPLNDTSRKALKSWLSARGSSLSERLFQTQRGAATTRAVQSILEEIGKDARVDGLTPHTARHSFAKNLVNSGVSLEKIAMLLGHSSLDTTMIYTTPGMSDLDRAVRILDN